MQLRSEAELEKALFDNWIHLRTNGRLDDVLPRCTTREWKQHDGSAEGYVTLDHRVHRQFRLPGAGVTGNVGIADLVETYWSVRTLDGQQNPHWNPSLNVHVVELKNRPLNAGDLGQLYRYMLALRIALQTRSISTLVEAERISLYVRGLLLGSEIPEHVQSASALLSHSELNISVGRFSLSPVQGIVIERSPRDEEMWLMGIHVLDDLRSVGDQLIAGAQLIRDQGAWRSDVHL